MTFQDIMKELSAAFVSDTRTDGGRFWKLRDDAPKWLQGSDFALAVHQAVDDRAPDDWVYESMAHLADTMAGYDFDDADAARDSVSEIADGAVDVYTSDLTAWLASRLDNVALVTEAREELGPSDDGVDREIMRGQYLGLERIAYAIILAVEEEAEAREEVTS